MSPPAVKSSSSSSPSSEEWVPSSFLQFSFQFINDNLTSPSSSSSPWTGMRQGGSLWSSSPSLDEMFPRDDGDNTYYHTNMSQHELMELELSSNQYSINETGYNETSLMLQDEQEDDLLMYKNFLTGSRFWVQRVLVPMIMLIGVLGNLITIVIMTRRRMRSSTNNYLAALATFDMLYLIFTFILSFQQYPNINDLKYYYYWKFFPFALTIADCCSNSSVWLTVTFTIERFIVVSHPIKGKIICTESRSRKVVLFVFLFCLTYVLPTPFEYVVTTITDPVTNTTIMSLDSSELGSNKMFKDIYYWLTTSLFTFIPLVLLTIFNSFLIRSVHISRQQRSDMTQSKSHVTTSSNGNEMSTSSRVDATSSKQENKITVMLIAVVILFFICQLPQGIMLIVMTFYNPPPGTKMFYIFRGLGNIFNFLMAINAAGNFLLYCFFSQRYRKTFFNVFCHYCYNNSGTTTSAYFQSSHPATISKQQPQQQSKSNSPKVPLLLSSNKRSQQQLGSSSLNDTTSPSLQHHSSSSPATDLKVIGSYGNISSSGTPSPRTPSSLIRHNSSSSKPSSTIITVTSDATSGMTLKTSVAGREKESLLKKNSQNADHDDDERESVGVKTSRSNPSSININENEMRGANDINDVTL